MIRRFLVPLLAASTLSLGLAGCGGPIIMTGDEGVPLSELDMNGAAPTELALASSDNVMVRTGDTLDIKVTGDPDAVAALRFNLEDGTLGIMREQGSEAKGKATVNVTMPPLHTIVLAGSGDVSAPELVDKGEVNIAGSGTVSLAKIAARRISVNVMGSGTMLGAGAADHLSLNVAGSGKLAARQLKVGSADINIAGSGRGEFASDGEVKANIAGSGEVTVYGRANCKVSAMGSGKLNCREAPAAPTPAPVTG